MVSPAIHSVTLGMMQGRLSNCAPEATQRFPTTQWQEEFRTATDCGFNALEWLITTPDNNPLLSEVGRRDIKYVLDSSPVRISTVCVDYFKSEELTNDRSNRLELLQQIIIAAQELSIGKILLPLCEQAEVRGSADLNSLRIHFLATLETVARNVNVEFVLETLCDPKILIPFLDGFRPGYVSAALDLGNAAAAGCNIPQMIRALGRHIEHVHIKDRKANNGPNVPLGQGNADFTAAFQALKEIGYTGAYVLETTRGNDPVAQARRHFEFVTALLKKENLIP